MRVSPGLERLVALEDARLFIGWEAEAARSSKRSGEQRFYLLNTRPDIKACVCVWR